MCIEHLLKNLQTGITVIEINQKSKISIENTSVFTIKMIIHYNHDKPMQVYVVNSRLPVYRAYYGDGLGNIIAGLFTRMAPKVAPIAKQLSMKAIDVIRDKGISAVGDLAGKAFSAAKDKLVSLVNRKRFSKKPTPLPSTTVMPASVSKVINSAVEQKLASLVTPPMSSDATSNAIMNAIAGSGLASKNLRRKN